MKLRKDREFSFKSKAGNKLPLKSYVFGIVQLRYVQTNYSLSIVKKI